MKATITQGLTEWKLDEKRIKITHTGNMGNTIKNVDENLQKMGLPTTDEYKEKAESFTEKGSPDYLYTLIIKY